MIKLNINGLPYILLSFNISKMSLIQHHMIINDKTTQEEVLSVCHLWTNFLIEIFFLGEMLNNCTDNCTDDSLVAFSFLITISVSTFCDIGEKNLMHFQCYA